jgi:predicted nucleic acid-binding protein
MPDDKRYWDSSVFLASIKNEPDRADICEEIINEARAGRCEIWTSAVTLTEVVKTRPRENPIDPKTESVIAAFFRNRFIRLVPLDVDIATRARRLIWDFPWLGTRDAIHIATAIRCEIPIIEHYDEDFDRVRERVEREKLSGFPEIRNPKWIGQLELRGAETVELPAGAPTDSESTPPLKADGARAGGAVDATDTAAVKEDHVEPTKGDEPVSPLTDIPRKSDETEQREQPQK